ncbi:hypothetical protein [Streptomyces violaceorubidus]|uniref:hypothetical protein n=1 Tax=Streptomyces violaceorubidus TaxID=284042 RepID=UPI0004C1B729|nr:hypothetical protein [Streptomyces violaceorubidus]
MTRTVRTTTKKTPAKKTAKKTTAPRTRKQTQPRLSLVKPTPPRPARALDFITDAQIYAVHTARQAGLPIHRIRDWRDHRDGTATRPLADGSTLHYTLATRTLRWQAICPMGGIHEYVLTSPSTAAAARVHADRCQQEHADLTTVQPLTPDELAALGIHTGPTWARPLPGEPATESIPLPARSVARATASAADTQPMSTREIAAGIAARADNDQPKEHPQP